MLNEQVVIALAREQGASVAGIAAMAALRLAPSHQSYPRFGRHAGIDISVDGDSGAERQPVDHLESSGSLLVIGLAHPEDCPELDWWDGRGTLGNRQLIDIVKRTRHLIEIDFKIRTRSLHYYVEHGGVFLKDAAVLAGLGCIGKNNLLVSPAYGPRIRLRALYLAASLQQTGPISFDPCADCPAPCRSLCPECALDGTGVDGELGQVIGLPGRDGAYLRDHCDRRMRKDDKKGGLNAAGQFVPVTYCRRCEFACPVGR